MIALESFESKTPKDLGWSAPGGVMKCAGAFCFHVFDSL